MNNKDEYFFHRITFDFYFLLPQQISPLNCDKLTERSLTINEIYAFPTWCKTLLHLTPSIAPSLTGTSSMLLLYTAGRLVIGKEFKKISYTRHKQSYSSNTMMMEKFFDILNYTNMQYIPKCEHSFSVSKIMTDLN